MGTDISGLVECRAWRLHEEGEPVWHAAVNLFMLYRGRDYDAFGCLFGVRNYANFRPLAAGRGRPADASDAVRAELDRLAQWPESVSGTSWITWAELKAVDWTELTEKDDSRIHEYRRTADGLEYVGKSAWSREFAEVSGIDRRVSEQEPTWPEGSEWRSGDRVYRSTRISRRDAVEENGEWQPVWTVMETLAALHGDENVRLVVWFDS
ncbi:hypothetical protein ABT095_21550 [Kitasatospora sp. NPDC002227]|uniref:hypothetical protein n=1 Tax=Kitasatospora sp. NPDC002227 TaxID=3154773 RepID=UPI003318F0B1